MANNRNLKLATFLAGVDLTATKHRCVVLSADGQCDPAGAGVDILGVLHQENAVVGGAISVSLPGSITKVEAGAGGITVGDVLMAAATGVVVTATATNKGIGICVKSAGAGELGEMLQIPLGTQ